jgi:PAS domain S-box-containing protein
MKESRKSKDGCGLAEGRGKLRPKTRCFHETVIEGMTDGLCAFDSDGRFTFVNDIMCKRSGYPAEWFIGRSYLDVVGADYKDRLRRGFQTILEGEDPVPAEVGYVSSAGTTVWLEVNASRFVDSDNRVGVLAVTRNITKRKKTADDLDTYRNDTTKPPRGYEFTIVDRFGNSKEIYMTVALIRRKGESSRPSLI